MTYADREEAGKRLATELTRRTYKRPLVLALPRGGVPIGREVALALECPLDTLVARKIGAPLNPEWAIGAIAPHGTIILDEEAMASASISRAAVEGVIATERKELARRITAYRSGSYSIGYVPKTVIIVDDGLATGMTARAALRAARVTYPKAHLVFAAPVCIRESKRSLVKEADEVVCLPTKENIYAVGQAYEIFPQLSDDEVMAILGATREKCGKRVVQ